MHDIQEDYKIMNGKATANFNSCVSEIEASLDIARELDQLLGDMHQRKLRAALPNLKVVKSAHVQIERTANE